MAKNKTVLKKISNVLLHWDRWEALLKQFNLDSDQIKEVLEKEATRRVTRMTYGRDKLVEK